MNTIAVTTLITQEELAKWGIVESENNLILKVDSHSFNIEFFGEGKEPTTISLGLTKPFGECVPCVKGSISSADWDKGYIEFRYKLAIAQRIASTYLVNGIECKLSYGDETEYISVELILTPDSKESIADLVAAAKEFVQIIDSANFRAAVASRCASFSETIDGVEVCPDPS